MFKIKANTVQCIFQNQFTEIQHQYLTRFSKSSFAESQLVYSQTTFSVSSRGPKLWNKLSDQQKKSLDHETSFKLSLNFLNSSIIRKRTKIFVNFLK